MLKDGDDYYLTFSSFETYPGLIIWHSTDLVNWQPIGPALHRRLDVERRDDHARAQALVQQDRAGVAEGDRQRRIAVVGAGFIGTEVASSCASLGAEVHVIDIADRPLLILVGNEGKGLSRLVAENCDAIVSIPIGAATESLNAGIATSIAMYEIAMLRGKHR